MGPKKQNYTSTFSRWFGHNMGSSDLWIYIGSDSNASFESSLPWRCHILCYRSNCRYNMMLSKLMHIKYHQKGTSPFPCIMRGKEM